MVFLFRNHNHNHDHNHNYKIIIHLVLDKLDRKNIIKFLPGTISNFAKIWSIIIPGLNDDNKINDSLIENCIKLTESISRFVDSNNKVYYLFNFI